MKNINVKNSQLLKDENKKYVLSRKIKTGIITAALVIGIPYLMFSQNSKNKTSEQADETIEEVKIEEPINVSLNELNNLNIVIDDNNCSDTFMDEIYKKLTEDGIKFNTSTESNNIDKDNCVVITLDQQYMSGPGVLIIAPYDNDRIGNSDALVLAADAAFDEKGFFVDGIECGIRGYKENNDGNIMVRLPSVTEEKINKDANTSFVTIEFGTDNLNADLVAKGLENTLARYYSYINSTDYYLNSEDLLYRFESDDTLEKIADMYGTKTDYIKIINNINSENGNVNAAIKNPSVELIREFDKTVPINLYIEKTNWLK